MADINELARQLQQSVANNPETREALDRIVQQVKSADGQNIAQNIPQACAGQIEQAAAAARRGDMNAAKDAIAQMMNSPEGAELARKLKFLMGK